MGAVQEFINEYVSDTMVTSYVGTLAIGSFVALYFIGKRHHEAGQQLEQRSMVDRDELSNDTEKPNQD